MSTFKTITKQTNQNKSLPDNTVRLRGHGLSIASNVVKRLSKYAHETKLGTSFRVSIQVDSKRRKLRLVPCKDGFSISVTKYGTGTMAAIPSSMRGLGMPQGDYYSGNNLNTFVYVK